MKQSKILSSIHTRFIHSRIWLNVTFNWTTAINRINAVYYKKNEILYLHAFGLGDMIFTATLLEKFSEHFSEIYIPCHKKNLVNLNLLFGYLNRVHFLPLESDVEEREAIRQIRKQYKLPLISCAQKSIFATRNRYPSLGLNTIYIRATGFKIESLVSSRLSHYLDTLVEIAKLDYPKGRYAFVDHIIDSPREIPKSDLDEIANRGLDLSFNDVDLGLLDVYYRMKNATELHLMGSALLCLAIVTNIRTEFNVYYHPEGAWELLTDEPSGVWKTRPSSN